METGTSKMMVRNVLCPQMYLGTGKGREKLEKIRNYLRILQ